MILEIIKMALESLRGNKTRTFLSMLGIIIGVSTVIAVVAIGEGAQKAVDEQFQGLSATSIIVMGQMGRGQTSSSKFSTDDAEIILKSSSHITHAIPMKIGTKAVSFGTENSSASIIGTSFEHFTVANLEIGQGKFFSEEDEEVGERYVVLGSTLSENLFVDNENPIGQTIKIEGKKYEVAGVLLETGMKMGPTTMDEAAFMSTTVAEKDLLGAKGMTMINVTADSVDNVEAVTEALTTALREEHRLKDSQADDFKIMDAGSMVEAAQSSAALMTFVLTAVAAIVLLVSGIGIMNVMFVSVSERTKEIGIAKAIGGKQSDILLQFLLESVILSMIGGIIGILLGQVAIFFINKTGMISVATTITGPLLGFSFSVIVGVFFGFYPAFKGSRLDPVDALRSE